jgi:pimeloyl-ACP methyl ester carboxylesterase
MLNEASVLMGWRRHLPVSNDLNRRLEEKNKRNTLQQSTTYHTTDVDGLSIFYREAGPEGAPKILLLHGFPSSSRMYEPIFVRLSDRYHLIAPDYPGFGHSDWPDRRQFDYTFDHLATVINGFTQSIGLSRYTLFMQDYGGPVGFRMALVHPERVQAVIIQNAVAHVEGLAPSWTFRRSFWDDRAGDEASFRANFFSFDATRMRHIGKDPNPDRYDPDLWTDELAFLNKPGQLDIQSDIAYDYRTNVDAYPKWQVWMRERQPPLLVTWGVLDLNFDPGEAERYRKDVPSADVQLLDGGHFALDTKAEEIASFVRSFMNERASGFEPE